jgi:hypothetical protein
MKVLSVLKEFNLKRHYTSLQGSKLKIYQGPGKIALLEGYTKKCKLQMVIFTRVGKTNLSSLTAAYNIALELAKWKKPFSDEIIVKKSVWLKRQKTLVTQTSPKNLKLCLCLIIQ